MNTEAVSGALGRNEDLRDKCIGLPPRVLLWRAGGLSGFQRGGRNFSFIGGRYSTTLAD